MRSLERFLTNIFNVTKRPSPPGTESMPTPGTKRPSPPGPLSRWERGRRFYQTLNSDWIGGVLKKGVGLLDEETQAELRAWVNSQQNEAGGFSDRGGACDLYYTLFGFFLADALEMERVMSRLKVYVKNIAKDESVMGINLFCAAILHSSLFPDDPETGKFIRRIRKIKDGDGTFNGEYSRFLVVLSLIYLRDHLGAWKALKAFGRANRNKDRQENERGRPCPVVAAALILAFIKSGFKIGDASQIMAFYQGNGGFAALADAPAPDLLSTAVALFALQFLGYDMCLIRPDCMEFVETLYQNGGFRGSPQDDYVDVEYTFYGLLALGAVDEK